MDNTTETSDSELVLRANSGDQEAFGILVNRYWAEVAANTRKILHGQEDAHDATQETFLRAYRHLGELRDARKVGPWLRKIAQNVARKSVRQSELAQRRLPPHELREDLARIADSGLPIGYREAKIVLGTLRPPDRTVVNLFYLIGFDIARIANTLDIPEGTVKSRLHRARRQLRERIKAMNEEARSTAEQDHGRDVICGMRGQINWSKIPLDDELSAWRPPLSADEKEIKSTWSRSGDAIVGDSRELGESAPVLIGGDQSWSDFELSVLITPVSACNAQVMFRYSDVEKNWYMFDMLLGWQAIAISRMEGGRLTKLSVVNYPLECGQEYEVEIAARENSITTYVDGKLVNQVTDEKFRSGSIALSAWNSTVAFRDLRYRLLN